MSLVLDEHRRYLADETRLRSFERAINEVVRPGNVVVDLGAGTGILGLLACRAGASRVYVIEETGIIEVARHIYRANALEDRAVFIKELSTRASLPERADVVLTDQIGRFGFEAGFLQYLADARRRFLKPGGVTIPRQLALWIAPVEETRVSAKVEFWNSRPAGFDFGAARSLAVNAGYPVKLNGHQLLGSAQSVAVLDPLDAPSGAITVEATVEITRPGTLHGIGGWFVAALGPVTTMTNSPLADAPLEPIKRRQVCFPIDTPLKVAEGDRIRVGMQILPRDSMVNWNVDVSSGKSFAHSTFHGMLIAAEDLRRTRPGFAPRLSAAGEARRLVLSLCDGQRELREIEAEVLRRHPALFCSGEEAAAFVAEVVTRYAV